MAKRPSVKEIREAARKGGAAQPSQVPSAPPAAKTAAAGALPPREKMTDPRDLAEAARQAAAKRAKDDLAAKAAAAPAPAAPAKPKVAPAKPQAAPPKPSRALAAAASVTTP